VPEGRVANQVLIEGDAGGVQRVQVALQTERGGSDDLAVVRTHHRDPAPA
jgi:hypothetical protein